MEMRPFYPLSHNEEGEVENDFGIPIGPGFPIRFDEFYAPHCVIWRGTQ